MKKLSLTILGMLLLTGCSIMPENPSSTASIESNIASSSISSSSEVSINPISISSIESSSKDNPYQYLDGGYDLFQVIENENQIYNIGDRYYGYNLKSDAINVLIDGNTALGYSSMFNKVLGYKADITNYSQTTINIKGNELDATDIEFSFKVPTDFGELPHPVDKVIITYFQFEDHEYLSMTMDLYESYHYQYFLIKVDVPSYLNEENLNKEYVVTYNSEFGNIQPKKVKFGQLVEVVTPPLETEHAKFVKWVLYENHMFKDFNFDEYIVVGDVNLIALYKFDMYELCYINTNTDAGTIDCYVEDVHYYYMDQSQPSGQGMGYDKVSYNYQTVCYESIVTLSVTVNEDYDFVGWYENDTLLSNEFEYQFAMTKERTIEARFEPIEY